MSIVARTQPVRQGGEPRRAHLPRHRRATRSATSTSRPRCAATSPPRTSTGDQADVLPTDTQKNTAFAFAKEHGVTSPEDYALALGRPLPRRDARPRRRAGSQVEEYAWDRIPVGPAPARPRVRPPRRRGPHRRSSP